jgi:2'-5' RNA ligase
MKLQKKLREELSAFQNYFTPESAQWERDFTPHITIARHLPPERLEEAKLSLQEDIACTGSITQIYLQIVEKKTSEETKKHENRTVFKL